MCLNPEIVLVLVNGWQLSYMQLKPFRNGNEEKKIAEIAELGGDEDQQNQALRGALPVAVLTFCCLKLQDASTNRDSTSLVEHWQPFCRLWVYRSFPFGCIQNRSQETAFGYPKTIHQSSSDESSWSMWCGVKQRRKVRSAKTLAQAVSMTSKSHSLSESDPNCSTCVITPHKWWTVSCLRGTQSEWMDSCLSGAQ